MISFFTIAREFSGHIGLIQRNALQSWKRLDAACEVLLLGDDAGSGEVAREFGLEHIPDVARNEYGSALVSDLFAVAHARAKHDLLCYINADIILLPDFIEAARRVRALNQPFLMCGRRWKLDITEPLAFDSGWEDRLAREAVGRGHLDDPMCADYFLFTRGLFGEIPPFAIGRRRWDRWLQYRARSGPGLYIDATEVVTAIHQNHDYGGVGFLGHKRGPETQRNIELSGDEICDLRAAPYKLTPAGVTRAIDSVRVGWQVRKAVDNFAAALKQYEEMISARLGQRSPRRLLRASHRLRRFLKSGSFEKKQRIAVVGLGKIGFPLAVALAHKGCTVAGADSDAAKVRAIQSGVPPTYEKGLAELLARASNRLTVQTDTEKAVCFADATFLMLPTQRDDKRGFTPDRLLSACDTVGRVMAHIAGYHLVVIVSTVLPGWTGGIIRTSLERASGKRAGIGFGLCYCPAFVALGNVVEGFLSPELVLIGESDPEAGMNLERRLARVWERPGPVVRTNFVNAELIKLALNTYVSTKISFANMLARMCEQLPGADVDVVTSALQLDSRVGRGYLTGGLSYGGPCFPGDVPTFATVARELGAPDDLAVATDAINTQAIDYLVRLIQRTTRPDRTVGICGVSFKPDTGAVDGSPGLAIAHRLQAAGYSVHLYDPQSTDHGRRWGGDFDVASSLEDCVRRANTIVLIVPFKEFSSLDPALLQSDGTRRVLIDCWRQLDRETFGRVADYHALGLGPPAEQSGEPRGHS